MKKKRVLILTHKLGHNYGGIMQAYALQEYLRQQGFTASTTSFDYESLKSKLIKPIKELLRPLAHKLNPSINDLPADYDRLINRHTQIFIRKYIKTLPGKKALSEVSGQRYDALIAGSDQVWRSVYVPVKRYLFDFAEGQNITRISYAASFGRGDLSEYGPELLAESKLLAKQFDAISVREDSGIELVKKYWDSKAEYHVDPTLLLDKEHYIELVSSSEVKLKGHKGGIFAYVLDREGAKGEIVDNAKDILGLQDFEIYPPRARDRAEFNINPEKFQLPPVEQWLKGFMDADFVITDSFHGTAFAIIFNKPFLSIGNKERGLARFTSLLKIFDLENRLVSESSQVSGKLLKQKINWQKANTLREQEKLRSSKYLLNMLS